MVSSISLPLVSQLLNPVNPLTGKVPTSPVQAPTATTASSNANTGQASNVSLSSEALALLQGTDSSSGANPFLSLLGGNSSDNTSSSLTNLYSNLLLTAVTSSISGTSYNAAAQKSVNAQAAKDPIQAVISAYNNAANSLQTVTSPSQTTSA